MTEDRSNFMFQKLEICGKHLKNCKYDPDDIAVGFLTFAMLECRRVFGAEEAANMFVSSADRLREQVVQDSKEGEQK